MLSWKQNMPWLNLRNVKTSSIDSCFVFYNFWYCLQSYKIWALVSIEELLYGHAINLLGKNLAYICQ